MKHKVALLMAYSGIDYSGMQHNPGVRTIESELERAIHLAGGITTLNAGSFNKVNWMRSARTDKGVSAIGQVVSFKLILDQEDIVEKINKFLPPAIRVFGYTRVVKSFDARLNCDKRRYKYMIPLSTLQSALSAEWFLEGNFENVLVSELNAILQMFIGSHKFHNFTSKSSSAPTNVMRYISEFSIINLVSIKGEKWLELSITGQSFLYNQIRKMVSLAIAVYLCLVPPDCIPRALSSNLQISIPLAPGIGLFLEESIYQSYNKRWGGQGSQVNFLKFCEEMEEFKVTKIYPEMCKHLIGEDVYGLWVQALRSLIIKFCTIRIHLDCHSNHFE